jgi:alanyl-tRNA synthetase
MKTSNELRQAFLDHFASHGHRVQPGISLVPTDPSVFLTNAGVVPFRHIIEGREKAAHLRVATCQRSLRISGKTNDISGVGRFARYHTFFEMLGNFSFGDYYKRESLLWGWELLVGKLGLDPDRVWASVYAPDPKRPGVPGDDEAVRIWTKEIGLPESRIVHLSDNFWGPVLETGACGPDSEVYYDLGERFGCGSPDCMPGCDCDRYLEIWNHVFTELYAHEDGTFTPLPQRNIDTGMGLERLTVAVQGVRNVYETDLFGPILEKVEELAGQRSQSAEERAQDWRKRVIADHSRAVAFMIMDGIYPSNTERGYVLRRLLRRASTFGRLVGIREPFIHEIVPKVVQQMRDAYPELEAKQDLILQTVRMEERQFYSTLEHGMRMLETAFAEAVHGVVPGDRAFRLYDTHGFPLELTKEMAEERGLSVDEPGFNAAMAAQKAGSRGDRSGKYAEDRALGLDVTTQFVGYDTTAATAQAVALLKDATPVERAVAGDEVQVVLDTTPFYAESGGQIGDTGWLRQNGSAARVLDTVKRDGVTIHRVRVESGELAPGVSLTAEVDSERRVALTRAHTATHLLHAALRNVLGEHVVQRGSVVEPDRLRFDFSHNAPVSPEELFEIERLANEQVVRDAPVRIEQKPIAEAKAMGAMALFGEKYGDIVRVVQVPGFSTEMCGGTHAPSTGTIGQVKVTAESGVAAGVRRIEAVTGMQSLRHTQTLEARLRAAAQALEGPPDQLVERVGGLKEQIAALRRQVAELRRASTGGALDTLLARQQTVEGVPLIAAPAEAGDADTVKSLVDAVAQRIKSGVVVLGSALDGRALFVAKVSPDWLERGVHAGNLVREIARLADGRGGGQAAFAQAGGSSEKLESAIAAAPELLRQQLAGSK